MKHYICLEEHTITYIHGRYKHSGSGDRQSEVLIREFKRVEADRDLDAKLCELAKLYSLADKKVILVIGRDVRMASLTFPRAGKTALKRMAFSELTAMGVCNGELAAAVDIQDSGRLKTVAVTAYYIGKDRLTEYMDALERAGIACGAVRILPDCMASAVRELYKDKPILLIDVQEEQIEFYVLSEGHCQSYMASSLKAARFCQRDAAELLYEELAEQAERMLRQLDSREFIPGPKAVMLNAPCLPRSGDAASLLKRRLELPCELGGIGTMVAYKINTEGQRGWDKVQAERMPEVVLACCVPDGISSRRRGVAFDQSGILGAKGLLRAISGSVTKRSAVFLLINGMAAVMACAYMGALRALAEAELTKLNASINSNDYKERYRSARSMEREIAEQSVQKKSADKIKERAVGMNLLGAEEYGALTHAMEPGMRIETIIYEYETNFLQVVISMEDPEEAPGLVEKARESGVFSQIGHSLWEEKMEDNESSRCYATFEAFLESGVRDEVQ